MEPECLEVMDAAEAVCEGFEVNVSIVRMLELFEHFERLGEKEWMQQISDIVAVTVCRSVTRSPVRV